MNWKAKVAIQSVLARLPYGEEINHRLQWANSRYTPERLKRRTLEQGAKLARLQQYVRDGIVVEVGTGWELIAPILFHLMGAKRIYTYDHLRHLRFDVPKTVIEQLDADELSVALGGVDVAEKTENLKRCRSLEELLDVAAITYQAPGDACHTGLQRSVDLFFSYETLEHVPEPVLNGLVAESKRILKPSGVAYHAIEPGDHYTRETSHINHYRYPEWLWRPLVKNSISYHNRLCIRQFVECFEAHGAVIQDRRDQSSDVDLSNLESGFKLDDQFAKCSFQDLAVWYSEIIYGFSAKAQNPPVRSETDR